APTKTGQVHHNLEFYRRQWKVNNTVAKRWLTCRSNVASPSLHGSARNLRLRPRQWILLRLFGFVKFDVLQVFADHHLVGPANACQPLGIEVRAFLDFRQACFQIAELLLGLLISLGGQNVAHSSTSTTPLCRFLLSVANWRVAQASKSASSA